MTVTTAPDTAAGLDFKVADLSLAEFGRKEIRLAEHEMPGLMELRREPDLAQALDGWFEAEPRRPQTDLPAGATDVDWLRFEQRKHEQFLTPTTPSGGRA